jgi:hypothetical protein
MLQHTCLRLTARAAAPALDLADSAQSCLLPVIMLRAWRSQDYQCLRSFIGHWVPHHYVALTGWAGNKGFIIDPNCSRMEIDEEELAKKFLGTALVFESG